MNWTNGKSDWKFEYELDWQLVDRWIISNIGQEKLLFDFGQGVGQDIHDLFEDLQNTLNYPRVWIVIHSSYIHWAHWNNQERNTFNIVHCHTLSSKYLFLDTLLQFKSYEDRRSSQKQIYANFTIIKHDKCKISVCNFSSVAKPINLLSQFYCNFIITLSILISYRKSSKIFWLVFARNNLFHEYLTLESIEQKISKFPQKCTLFIMSDSEKNNM